MIRATSAAVLASDVQQISARVANFREIGTAFKHVTDQLKRRNPDMDLVRDSAHLIRERGAHMLEWFAPGSEPIAPVETSWWERIRGWFSAEEGLNLPEEAESHARIEAWTQRAAFEQAQQAFLVQADRLSAIARGTDRSAIAAQTRALGKSCEGCHDRFRYEID